MPEAGNETTGRRHAPVWFFAPLLLAAAAILFVRGWLGFQFPVPWPDESGFVAQAFALAHTGSLFEPGMNPDRIVMWMPPGYMVLLAAIYRLLGYGFGLTRWISTLCTLGSLALAGGIAWRLTAGWRRVAAACGVGVAFLSPYMLVDANLARMEALFCALILLALLACLRGRLYLAAALVAATGLVHFNAIYFVLPVIVALVWAWRAGRVGWPGRGDWAALAGAGCALLLYALFVWRNRVGFIEDMAFQFALKRFYGHVDPAHPAWVMVCGAALAAFCAVRPGGKPGQVVCALFGVAFLVMAHGGHELWYDYGQALGFALIAIALLGGGAGLPVRRDLAAACAAMLALFMAARISPQMRELLPTPAMLNRSIVAPAEITKVRSFIAGLKPGETVDFGFVGMEPFFFDDLWRAGAHWQIIRHSVTQVWPLRRSDYRITCDSSEWTRSSMLFDIDHPRLGKDTGCAIFKVH